MSEIMTRECCWVIGQCIKRLNKKNGLNDTEDKVYDVMRDVDLEGLRQRQPRLTRKKEKDTFTEVGPNFCMSLDDYDKLWKGTFPLAIYGCRYIDTAS